MARMVRTQVCLTDEQAEQLKRIAHARGVSMAVLVREGVDAVIESDDRTGRWERLLATVGKFRSRDGATDVSVNHDKYLDEIYGKW